MEPIGKIIAAGRQRRPDRRTERGELLRYFTDKINADRDGNRFKKLPVAAVGVKLSHLALADLYYLKSTCEDAERRGKPFSAIFWWSIKPKPEV